MTRKRKRLFLFGLPILLLFAGGLWAKHRIDVLESEALALADTGKAAIQVLGELAKAVKEGEPSRLEAVYADDYEAPVAGFWSERLRSERDGVRVYDWVVEERQAFGQGDVTEQWRRLGEGFESFSQSKLKLAHVEEIPAPDRAQIRSVLWLRGARQGGQPVEVRAHLRMWLARQGEAWRIQRQELLSGETVSGQGVGFEDIAAAAGIDHPVVHNPQFFTPEWLPERFQIIRFGASGVSAGDYDGDGWYDLLYGNGLGCHLYRNRGDGTFEEVTEAVGLPSDLPSVNVSLFADFDNDGDQDIVLGVFTSHSRLYRNDGDGTFTDVSEGLPEEHGFVTVASAADYDGDGDLDLYLGRYLDPRTELPTTLFYTRNGEGNSLYRNDGGLRFTEVTEEAGVAEGGLTLGVAWADYDSDGDADLYVANDFGRNALLENQGDGTFVDVSGESDAIDFGFGMSASWGDVDNDGDSDVYVSNVHSGQRWYGQSPSLFRYLLNSVRQGTIWEDFSLYREIFGYVGARWHEYGDRMVKGNSLLLNDEGRGLVEVAEVAGANPYGWYWGASIFDFDNDGRQDIYAANGWISGKSYDDL